MSNVFQQLFVPAATQRIILLINHVLRSEDVAMARLRPHAGRSIRLQFQGWPALLPALPALLVVITPAGLFEWCGDQARTDADLTLDVEASNPALELVRSLAGQAPRIRVSGDAGLATDMSWITENLKWDVQDDLAAIIGPAAAHEMARVGRGLAGALRGVIGLVLRQRPGDAETAAR